MTNSQKVAKGIFIYCKFILIAIWTFFLIGAVRCFFEGFDLFLFTYSGIDGSIFYMFCTGIIDLIISLPFVIYILIYLGYQKKHPECHTLTLRSYYMKSKIFLAPIIIVGGIIICSLLFSRIDRLIGRYSDISSTNVARENLETGIMLEIPYNDTLSEYPGTLSLYTHEDLQNFVDKNISDINMLDMITQYTSNPSYDLNDFEILFLPVHEGTIKSLELTDSSINYGKDRFHFIFDAKVNNESEQYLTFYIISDCHFSSGYVLRNENWKNIIELNINKD